MKKLVKHKIVIINLLIIILSIFLFFILQNVKRPQIGIIKFIRQQKVKFYDSNGAYIKIALNKNQQLTVYDITEKRVLVNHDGEFYWIDIANPFIINGEGRTGTTKSYAKLRQSPPNGKILKTIEPDSKIIVYDFTDDYYYVKDADSGKNGYIWSDLIILGASIEF